jgi:hypothetical protein
MPTADTDLVHCSKCDGLTIPGSDPQICAFCLVMSLRETPHAENAPTVVDLSPWSLTIGPVLLDVQPPDEDHSWVWVVGVTGMSWAACGADTRALAIRAALSQADTWLTAWRAEVRAAAESEGVRLD